MTGRGDGAIRRILIVGGGTAGWLAACHLAKKLRSGDAAGVRVTLIESAEIPTIGVGEGTVPAIRQSLAYLGISETDFIRECDVTFKQSIKFTDWMRSPEDGQTDSYHHVFDYPVTGEVDLTPYWLMGEAGDASFVDAVSVQGTVCDAGLGPKVMTHPEYEGATSYAYHLDAGKFAAFLARHATENLGVEHLFGNVRGVRLDDDGAVAAIETDALGTLTADLYVDCTGFRSLILGAALDVGFVDKSGQLFTDHAVAVRVPYATPDAPIPCETRSIAQEAGWIWDIGLTERRGTGYVYASKYTSHERAEAVLRDYLRDSLGDTVDDLDLRRIPMRIGYREASWYKNCVAIGLSQGFVEPLEATGILMYDATARMLADQMPPTRDAMPAIAARFNARITTAWDRVIDFIKLHYYLSERDDTDFWRDNRDPATVSASLLANLEVWRDQPPSPYDFTSRLEIFNIENYLYILYGMKFATRIDPIRYRFPDGDTARRDFARIREGATTALNSLLPHRELINRIRQFGLQKI